MRAFPADRCSVPQAFWRAVARLDLEPAALLRQARLPTSLHLQSRQLITTAQFFAIWRALEELSGDPGIGIRFVEASDAAGHQPLFLAALYAANFRDGIARIADFKRLASPQRLVLEERRNEISISRNWLHATEPEPPVSVDVNFAFLVALGRRGTGRHLTPIRVDLARSGPANALQRSYFGCPINLDASHNELVLKSADLNRPFPAHNPELLEILTPALSSSLGDFGPDSTIINQVKIVLKRSLGNGRPDLGNVARELETSERTLQRRITDAGTTFRALVAEARRELGRQLLRNASLEVHEVGFLLGYQDASSFYRAFRAWESMTPSDWRAKNRG